MKWHVWVAMALSSVGLFAADPVELELVIPLVESGEELNTEKMTAYLEENINFRMTFREENGPEIITEDLLKYVPRLNESPELASKWKKLVEDHKIKLIPMDEKFKTRNPGVFANPIPDAGTIAFRDLKPGEKHWLAEDLAFQFAYIIPITDFHFLSVDEKGMHTRAFQNAVNGFFQKHPEFAHYMNVEVPPKIKAPLARDRYTDEKKSQFIWTVMAPLWRQKRALYWQLDWYGKAVAKHRVVARFLINDLHKLFRDEPEKFEDGQVQYLMARIQKLPDFSGFNDAKLLHALWDHELPPEFDFPKR